MHERAGRLRLRGSEGVEGEDAVAEGGADPGADTVIVVAAGAGVSVSISMVAAVVMAKGEWMVLGRAGWGIQLVEIDSNGEVSRGRVSGSFCRPAWAGDWYLPDSLCLGLPP